ncbi:MAG: ferredoxin [Deltaproteobacteria bacterium]|nr:ferredoxin [Deltaproteobacteria bacterium]
MPREYEVIEDDCIGCRLCVERAPENLEIPEGASVARVFHQPANAEEEEAVREAAEYCPMGALHKNKEVGDAPSLGSHDRSAFAPAGDSMPADSTLTELEN